jgi:transposase
MAERREREAEKHWRRERENGRKEEGGPSNGNKLEPTKKLSPDLNPAWI